MPNLTVNVRDFHWGIQALDTIDVGLVVLDVNYEVCLWNSFMQNYSGIIAPEIMHKNLFDVIDNLPEDWFKAKIDAAVKLNTRTFSRWEDRPYVFHFKNYSPYANELAVMYQNMVVTPLKSLNGDVSHVCIMIQDVSDIAKNKLYLEESNQLLSTMSRTDGLTQLLNRTYWESLLIKKFNKISTTEAPASLVIFDIDHFKKVNDTYGHTAGDEVIRKTARELRKAARATDHCGRYGGEEFTVLLPNTSIDQARYFAERLRKRIESQVVSTDAGDIKYTISLGVCAFDKRFTNHAEWLENADKALYESKRAGRNQTTVAELF